MSKSGIKARLIPIFKMPPDTYEYQPVYKLVVRSRGPVREQRYILTIGLNLLMYLSFLFLLLNIVTVERLILTKYFEG